MCMCVCMCVCVCVCVCVYKCERRREGVRCYASGAGVMQQAFYK